MDYQLVALIGMIAGGLFIVVKKQTRPLPAAGRRGNEYQRVITCAVIGLLFTVSGIIGWDLSHSGGWFQATKWVDGPLWWEVGLGTALLLPAVFWAQRVPSRPSPR